MGPTSELADPRDIVGCRVLPFPRVRVFDAWTDPARLTRWWGPKGFTSTFEQFDLRPGGVWRFVLYGPNGASYPNESVFVEIVPPERIVFDHVSKPVFQVTATFAEVAGGTELTFRQRFETPALRDKIATFAVEANEQNLDRLEAELARGASA